MYNWHLPMYYEEEVTTWITPLMRTRPLILKRSHSFGNCIYYSILDWMQNLHRRSADAETMCFAIKTWLAFLLKLFHRLRTILHNQRVNAILNSHSHFRKNIEHKLGLSWAKLSHCCVRLIKSFDILSHLNGFGLNIAYYFILKSFLALVSRLLLC